MDKLVKILRTILIAFFILWVVIWFSIRAFKLSKMEGKNIGLVGEFITVLDV